MKRKAPRNRTLTCSKTEIDRLSARIFHVQHPVSAGDIEGEIIGGNVFDIAGYLPKKFVDLLILDPPYNLSKNYHGHLFKARERDRYQKWFQRVIEVLLPALHPHATIYACSDWRTSVLIAPILESQFHIRNRPENAKARRIVLSGFLFYPNLIASLWASGGIALHTAHLSPVVPRSSAQLPVRPLPDITPPCAFSFFSLWMDTWITPLPTHSSPWRGGQLLRV